MVRAFGWCCRRTHQDQQHPVRLKNPGRGHDGHALSVTKPRRLLCERLFYFGKALTINRHEATAQFANERKVYESGGAIFENVKMYIPDGWKHDFDLAMDQGLGMDAQPQLSTTQNTGIPVWLSTMIDPTVYEILFSPLRAADILGETRRATGRSTP